MTQGNAFESAASDQGSRPLDIPGQAQFLGEYIRRPCREQSQRDRASRKPIDHFVQGSIASTDDHHLSAVANGPAGQFSPGSGSVDRRYFRFDSLLRQYFARTLKRAGMEGSRSASRRINN
jgi:hypothetical protein